MELACPLRSAAKEVPGSTAIEAPDGSFSFAELDEIVSALARRIHAHEPDDGQPVRIALCLDNGWRLIAFVLAAIRAGAVACPVSTRLPDATIERLRAQIGAALFVTNRTARDSIHPDELLERAVGAYGDEAKHALWAGADPARLPLAQPATIVFTSGSTGEPRAALHTYGNHIFSAKGSNANIRLERGDRWLLSLPLFHVGGLAVIFRCLLAHATIVLPEPDEPLHRSLARATHVSMVATQLRRVLQAGSVPALKAVLLGGSAIPASLIDEAYARQIPIHTSYGMTEMASQVATTPPGASRDVLRTSGYVLPHRELHVDSSGQIHVRGETRFAGYVNGADLEQPFDADGWFATGDLGRLGSDGLLHVLGRIDNMFVSGGENVIAEAIEAVLASRDDVRQAVVVPVQDEEFGHRPVAFVLGAPGRSDERSDLSDGDSARSYHDSALPDEDELRKAVAAELPRFMIPDHFFPLPPEFVGDAMKVDRGALTKRAERLLRSR